jgi:hypothetical protein
MIPNNLDEEAYLEFMAIFNTLSADAMHDPEKVADLLGAAILRSVMKQMSTEMIMSKSARDILAEHADGMFYDIANEIRK